MENKTSIKIAHELFTYIRLHIELNTFLESVNYQVFKIEIRLVVITIMFEIWPLS